MPTPACIIDLSTERLTRPLGVATPRPLFGWRLDSREAGDAQSGYEMEVRDGDGHLQWATGVVRSARGTDVEYAGPPLRSDCRHEWRVRAWTVAGVTGLLRVDLQGPYVLALAFGLIPPDKRSSSIARLKHLILANGRRLDTGFLSTPHVLDVLWDAGEKELARDLVWSERSPSWLYAVKLGATTVWESWGAIAPDGTPSMSSLNHYAFGCVDDWIFRRIAGIAPLAPGYSRVRVEPDLAGPLSSLRAHLDTVHGRIEVAWSKRPRGIDVDVSIPSGVVAGVQWGSRCDVLTAGRHRRRLEPDGLSPL